MPSYKQKKAQDLNWMKAQVINAMLLMRRVDDAVRKYNMSDLSLLGNIKSAKHQLTTALGKWDKEIWGKED
jgi:hypothetical protein